MYFFTLIDETCAAERNCIPGQICLPVVITYRQTTISAIDICPYFTTLTTTDVTLAHRAQYRSMLKDIKRKQTRTYESRLPLDTTWTSKTPLVPLHPSHSDSDSDSNTPIITTPTSSSSAPLLWDTDSTSKPSSSRLSPLSGTLPIPQRRRRRHQTSLANPPSNIQVRVEHESDGINIEVCIQDRVTASLSSSPFVTVEKTIPETAVSNGAEDLKSSFQT